MTVKPPPLTPLAVARLTEQQAVDLLRLARWGGKAPVCPTCGRESYFVIRRQSKTGHPVAPSFRCPVDLHTFSLIAETAFANTKLPLNTLLFAVSLFVTAPIGMSAEHLAAAVGISPTTARILQHKLREVMAREQDGRILSGEVEADGCFIGGHNRPKNECDHRDDRRRQRFQVGAQCVFAVRQRKGPTLVAVFHHEKKGRAFIKDRVEKGSKIFTDSASHFTQLVAHGKHHCINHKRHYFQVVDGELVHTNNVESFFNRLRDAEHIYGHIGGEHLYSFAVEQAWRQDHRNEIPEQKLMWILTQACAAPASDKWKGYFQRRTGRNATRRPNPLKVRNALRRWQVERAIKREKILDQSRDGGANQEKAA